MRKNQRKYELIQQVLELKTEVEELKVIHQQQIDNIKRQHEQEIMQLKEQIKIEQEKYNKSPQKDIDQMKVNISDLSKENNLLIDMLKASQQTCSIKENDLIRLRIRVKKLESDNISLMKKYNTLEDVCQTVILHAGYKSTRKTQVKGLRDLKSKSLHRERTQPSEISNTTISSNIQLNKVQFKLPHCV